MALLGQMYGCGREPDRDLTFVGMFAGEAAVSRGMRLMGFRGEALDARRSTSHDFLTPTGFLVTLHAVMRIRCGGVLWAAPPCSTWVFLSRHSTGRNKNPSGNWETSAYVASQNALVCRLLLLARLCIARRVHYIIEQPRSSCMCSYGPFAKFLEKHPALSVFTEMGAFGMRAEKDMILIGTAPYLPMLERRLTSEQRKDLRNDAQKKQTTKVAVRADGTKNVQGGRDLKSTQAYPIGFGCAHALSFAEHDTAATADDVPPATVKRLRPTSIAAAADAESSADDSDEDLASMEGSVASPPAAVSVGPHSFLPAHDGGPRSLQDQLQDMSDDEDPWYLDDLRTWNPKRWHDNSPEENKLKLSRA